MGGASPNPLLQFYKRQVMNTCEDLLIKNKFTKFGVKDGKGKVFINMIKLSTSICRYQTDKKTMNMWGNKAAREAVYPKKKRGRKSIRN